MRDDSTAFVDAAGNGALGGVVVQQVVQRICVSHRHIDDLHDRTHPVAALDVGTFEGRGYHVDGWLRMNLDTGAGVTVFPKALAPAHDWPAY